MGNCWKYIEVIAIHSLQRKRESRGFAEELLVSLRLNNCLNLGNKYVTFTLTKLFHVLKKITLIIEKSHHSLLWGRIKYKNNLLLEKASSVVALERKMKKLLADFHDLTKEKIEFEIAYDLSVFFEQKDFLNISGIAKLANLNASLLRQYAAGIKFPSPEKAAEIEGVIRRIGNELSMVNISARVREGEEKRNKMAKL